jgi:hypothetical protein
MSATCYLHLGTPLIDIRRLDRGNVLLRHVVGACSLPAASWGDRALELPPRCTPFSLLHDDSEECLALLGTLGGKNAALGQDLHAVYVDSDEAFWRAVPEQLIDNGPWAAEKQGRLWRPGPLTALLAAQWTAWGLPLGEFGAPVAILDCGCGQGRNAVYLLQTLSKLAGMQALSCVCVDNRLAMVDKCVRFAVRAVERLGVCTGGAEFSERTQGLALGTWGAAQAPLGGVASTCTTAAGHQQRVLYGVKGDILEWIEGGSLGGEGDPGPVGGSKAVGQVGQWCPPLQQGAGAAEAGLLAAPPPPRAYNAILFMRTMHREAISSAVDALNPKGGILAVETFHTSTSHPKERAQQLEFGEVASLVWSRRAGVQGWRMQVLHEQIVPAEDGRPLLQCVVWVGLNE